MGGLVVVGGGWSPERPVSLRSMAAVAAALADGPRPISTCDLESLRALADLIGSWRQGDAAFLCLHGKGGGEEGLVQAALEAAGIPYSGSGPLASALAIDKPRAKARAAAEGVPVLPHALVGPGSPRPRFAGFGPELALKPQDQGSSEGVVMAGPDEPWEEALAKAPHARLMAEPRVRGQELTIGVLGEGAEAKALAPVLITPRKGAFYDAESKYAEGGSDYTVNPALGGLGERLARDALAVHNALGCRGATRSDFLAAGQDYWFLEINTIPGLTATSLLPKSAHGAGLSFADLLEEMAP